MKRRTASSSGSLLSINGTATSSSAVAPSLLAPRSATTSTSTFLASASSSATAASSASSALLDGLRHQLMQPPSLEDHAPSLSAVDHPRKLRKRRSRSYANGNATEGRRSTRSQSRDTLRSVSNECDPDTRGVKGEVPEVGVLQERTGSEEMVDNVAVEPCVPCSIALTETSNVDRPLLRNIRDILITAPLHIARSTVSVGTSLAILPFQLALLPIKVAVFPIRVGWQVTHMLADHLSRAASSPETTRSAAFSSTSSSSSHSSISSPRFSSSTFQSLSHEPGEVSANDAEDVEGSKGLMRTIVETGFTLIVAVACVGYVHADALRQRLVDSGPARRERVLAEVSNGVI